MNALPFRSAVRELAPYPMERLASLRADLRTRGVEVHDFGTGDPIEPTPAFLREAFLRAVPEVSQYPTVAGRPELRRAIAGYLERRFGVRVDPDREVLPTSGSKEAIYHLPSAFIEPGGARRGVGFLEPCYPVYRLGAIGAGAEPVRLELRAEDGFVFRPDLPGRVPADAEKKLAILWINSPHNPTGSQMTREELARVAAWARERGILLAADECYGDVHGGDPPPSLLQVAREGVLVFHSLSKRSGMTGYRQGFLAGDRALVADYRSARAGIGVAPHEPGQAAATLAWSDDAHAEARRRVFEEKRALFLAFFREVGIEVVASRSAILYLWIRIPRDTTTAGYAEHLANSGILVSPGTDFGAAGKGFVRLALVPTIDGCKRAIEAWKRTLR
ncbi:MAG TPA: aminotransferase class I/II-fold pyridoxal phosphate-dependent enzyme [Planctomycetota bacterium]|nr:aminotransferase class I/II-fold pyridoxal phosphate-dependent enzyme [Planctomycetota bacterium]